MIIDYVIDNNEEPIHLTMIDSISGEEIEILVSEYI